MIAAIAYCRVSTTEQKDTGLSLEAQRDAIKEYAARNNFNISIIISEAVSGRKNDISRLIACSENVIIITDISRFCRNYELGLEVMQNIISANKAVHFIKENIIVNSLTFSARTRQVYLQLCSGLKRAEDESKQISDRIKSVLAYKRKRGQYTGGGVPFGLKLVSDNFNERNGNARVVKKYAFDSDELNIVKFVERCRSTRYTGDELTTLMCAISKYQDPIELVHQTIADHENYEEVHKVNTKPMDFADICNLLNDYEVLHRGTAFTIAKLKKIRTVNALNQYVGEPNEDIDEIMEQFNNLSVEEDEDSEEELRPQRKNHKRARREVERSATFLSSSPTASPTSSVAAEPAPEFNNAYKFEEEYKEFLEFKKFLALKNKH